METADTAGASHGTKRDAGILAIGAFKLVEAVFFLLLGLGAIHFLHSDLGDAATRVARELRVDPESHLVSLIIDHLDAITAKRLREIGLATFLYAALRAVEGVGLVMQQVWAEYLTVGVTVSFLPWEMYEIWRELTWFRVALFVVNLAVLAYLVWWLKRRRHTSASVTSGSFGT